MNERRLSIRVTEDQHEQLAAKAGRKTVSQYVREQLKLDPKARPQRPRQPKPDEVVLARILIALGSSDMPASMRELAAAAKNGALPESPDILLQLQAACLSIQKMRADLIKALGVEPEE